MTERDTNRNGVLAAPNARYVRQVQLLAEANRWPVFVVASVT